jgi:adenylate cyclase
VTEPLAPRRLATIVAIDVAGYSARTAANEDASAEEIAVLAARVRSVCAAHGGRVFNTAGDGFMLEFGAVTAALEAADDLAGGEGPPIRIGVHLGEVRVAAGDDLLGHGVNVAARIQALAPPGGVLVSADVRRAIRGALASRLIDRGEVQLDKMDEAIQVFALVPAGAAIAASPLPVLAAARDPVAQRRWTLRRRALVGGAGAAAALAAGYGGWRLLGGAPAWPEPQIAVLPFDNLSAEPDLAFFADGLSEDILDALVRGGGLRVTSRASSFTFRGAAKARAGEALKVGYLLDGSVLRNGARLRVNARLTDVGRAQVLWSETYDRDLGQGLQVEDEVAAQVAAALKVQIAGGAARTAVDPAAYDLYLQGRAASRLHTPESVAQGGQLLRQAVARAPGFPKAWFELASNYLRIGALEPLAEQTRDAALAQQAARRALALDPGFGAAYGLLATASPVFGRWAEVEAILAKGLAISPNDPDMLFFRGAFLCACGRAGASLDALPRALTLNPLDQFTNQKLCSVLTATGRFDEAGRVADRIAAIWPATLGAFWDRFWLLATCGREREAADWLEDRRQRPPGFTQQYDVYAAALRAALDGDRHRRDLAAAGLVDLAGKAVGYACQGVILLARMGLPGQALELAEAVYLKTGTLKIERNVQFVGSSRYQAFEEPETSYLFHPFLAPLRRDGRLTPIFDAIGLTAYWRQIAPPDDR